MKSFAFDYRDISSKNHIGGILFIGLVFLFGYLLFLIPREDLASLVLILLGVATAILIIVLVEPEDFKFLFTLFMVGFGIRIFIGLAMFLLSYQYGVADGFLFESDAHSYSQKGWYIAQCSKWGLEADPHYAATKVASGTFTKYDLWCGLVYSYTGESPLTLCFINSLAGSLIIVFLYSLAKNLAGKKVAIISSIFAAFWPSLIMWSTQSFKDPLIAFAVVVFFYSYIKLKKNLKIYFLPIMVVCLFVLWNLSAYVAIAVFMATCIAIPLSIKILRKNIILTAVFVLAVAYFGINSLGDKTGELLPSLQGFHKSFGIFNLDTNLFKMIDFQRRARAEGRLAILPDMDISSFTKALLYLPIGFVFVLFAPFPWQIGNVFQLMAVPETLLFYLLLPKLLRGIRMLSGENWGAISAIVIFVMIMSLIFALVEGNSGTLLRHRSYIIYLCFIFISVGILRKELVASEKDKT